MSWFWNRIYGSEPKEFVSSFGIEMSVQRLAAATGRSGLSVLTSQMAVGKVTESQVRLQRAIPIVANSFKPIFIGGFVEEDGRVVLRGRFAMAWYIQIFMTIWFGFLALWTVLVLLLAIFHESVAWWFPFAGIGMFALGVGYLWGAQWLTRNDVAWLSQVIEKELSSGRP